MAAITQSNVYVTYDEWTQLSDADVQTLQILTGTAGVIFAATQPAATVEVGSMGHVLRKKGGFLNNSTGGISWGRAAGNFTGACLAVTEG